MRNRLNNDNDIDNDNKDKCCTGDILTLIIIFFIMFIVIYTLTVYVVTGVFAETETETEKQDICNTAIGWESNYDYCDKLYDEMVEKDEQVHKEWAEENKNYRFVKCPNDTNTYPEGTKCGGPNIDWDEVKDNTEVNRQEEKAMREADD